ncbi:lipocalin family protein [Marinoscillum furvescens]|uniref:Lipocalin-like domain-containing protein n=1 Tax=Marinoscillum furvescens DSM 4134 TaxID=1122208 RepID=A0A3D9L4S8_MARFU|nr:lipocalin family protein [Marinoscillum furvescens]RED99414.1 hypothetical protein C7460_10830 [Marinoscillum furvescens DSM 4134]
MTQLTTFTLLFIVSLFTPQNDSTLYGKWIMYKVLEGGEDVTSTHNPEADRFIIFKPNGTFESGGTPYGKNTGKFTFQENNTLYLDSDAGSEDDSYWTWEISGSEMTWTGVGSPRAEQFTIIHRRTAE